MHIRSWYQKLRLTKFHLPKIWFVLNQPVIVGVVLVLGLPYMLQKHAESFSKLERVERADLQIGNAVYIFQPRLNASTTCVDIATALSSFNSPISLYPEFKDMSMTGMILILMKNLPDEKGKYALYPVYEAVSSLQSLEPLIRKSCNVESTKKVIQGYLTNASKIRPWFNIPMAYEHLMR
jgi:hypothetical protein